MKKLFTFAVMLLISITAFTQQALWGGSQIVSPEIHSNNTVTFRLKAPKAVKVELTGDFLPTQKIDTPRGTFDAPGMVELEENKEGVWNIQRLNR